MRPQATLALLASPADAIGTPSPMLVPQAEAHYWLNTETLKTRFCDFEVQERLSRRRHGRAAA